MKEEMTQIPGSAGVNENTLLMSLRVSDYDKFTQAHETSAEFRASFGIKDRLICRGLDDENMVLIVMTMEDLDKAREFSLHPALAELFKNTGVSGVPIFNFLETQFLDEKFMEGSSFGVQVSQKIKHYADWKKTFDGYNHLRIDAGLTDKLVGYDFSQHHLALDFSGHNLLNVLTSITDLGIARAFFASSEFNEKMIASGVIGEPSLFFFRVV